MAAPKTPVIDETPVSEEPTPTLPPPIPGPRLYTLDEAFSVLRQALATYYDAHDNMPGYLRAQELQMIFDNGGANVGFAWAQMIPLLEQALGVPLRIT